MVKKTLLSLAVATALASMAGCNVSTTDKYENKHEGTPPSMVEMPKENGVAPVFDPANGVVPLGIDFLYANTTDGTVNTADKTPPVTTAMNQLAGFSTVAPIYINVKGVMNPATLNAGTEVFLLKLKNKVDGTPVDAVDITKLLGAVGALTAAGPNPTKFADAFDFGDQPSSADYDVDQVILSNNGSPLPSIRISPKKPLDPRSKYLVVVTNKVQDGSGNSLVPPSTYELARGEQKLPSSALDGVRSLVKLWDGLAKTYLIGTGKLDPTAGEDVIFSYTFTTDDALNTLVSYAAPELFLLNNLSLEKAEDLADKANGQEPGTKIAARQATYNYLTAPAPHGLSLPLPAAPQGYFVEQVDGALEDMRTNPTYQQGLFSTLAQTSLQDTFGIDATIRDLAVSPAPREVKVVPAATADFVLSNAPAGAPVPPNTSPRALLGSTSLSANARFIQGYIELPKFLGSATLTTPVADPVALKENVATALRADSRWTANKAVGQLLTIAADDGNVYPPKDNDENIGTNVTYRFPFPEAIGMQKVPLLVAMPDAADGCTAPYPVVMYVHGITGSRTNVLPMAGAMAGAGLCTVTVAIDLPEHGVAPQTTGPTGGLVANPTMPFNMEAASGLWPQVIAGAGLEGFDGVKERHNGVFGSLFRAEIVYGENAVGDSGSSFINMQNFGRTRDNLRQAVVDLLNLNASLSSLDVALGGTDAAPVLDLAKAGVVGHSLGGMVASTFVAVNNQAVSLNTNLTRIKTVTLANTGSHLTKLLENSPAFAPVIVGGLADAKTPDNPYGVPQGSASFESFLSVFQANIEAVDPVVSLSKIDVPVATITALNDTTVPNVDYFSDESNPYLLGLQAEEKLTASWNHHSAEAPLAGAQGLSVLNPTLNNTDLSLGSTHSTFANPEDASKAEVGGIWFSIFNALNN